MPDLTMLPRYLRTVGRRLARGDDGPDLTVPPLSISDAAGREIRIRTYDGDLESLVELYRDFDPAHRTQGVPPVGESAIRDWLDVVVDDLSVLAYHGDRTVGHVMFVPDESGDRELAVFVHQDYQRAGIGSVLLRAGLGYARREGVTRVWLTVEPGRRGVQKLYREVGFTTDVPGGTVYRMSRRL